MERTAIASISTIQEAFKFFEAHNEMKRVQKNGKRYIIQPQRLIEVEEDTGASVSQERKGGIAKSLGGVSLNRYHNKNNINNNKKLSCASDDGATSRFDEFWNAYPRKRDKDKARKAWIKHNLNEKADLLLADIKKRLALDAQWMDKQFIPYPTTYMNNARWTDAIEEAQAQMRNAQTQKFAPTAQDYAINDPRHPDYQKNIDEQAYWEKKKAERASQRQNENKAQGAILNGGNTLGYPNL